MSAEARSAGQRQADHSPEAVLANPWLTLGRVLWAVTVLALLVSYAATASRGSRMLLVEPMVQDSYAALNEYVTYAAYARFILALRYFVIAIFFASGLFIFWRKSNTVMGVVSSLAVILLPMFAGLGGQEPYYPETLGIRFATLVPVLDTYLYIVWFVVALLFIALFPNGRFANRTLRLVGLVSFAWLPIAMLFAILSPDWDETTTGWILFIVVSLLCLLTAIGGAIYRYFRVSTPIEKQQTRWVMASLIAVVLWAVFVAGTDPFLSFDSRAAPYALFQLFGTVLVVTLVPLAIARAITSYHLWDIDVVIRRTLVYTLLTGALLAVYLLSIVVLQGVFTRLTGQSSTLATILSTLLIAALFLPLRRRIQAFIDRRFFRRKYDAALVLENFAASARDETDLDQLIQTLLGVIDDTMQPETLSLWLIAEQEDTRSGKDSDPAPLTRSISAVTYR